MTKCQNPLYQQLTADTRLSVAIPAPPLPRQVLWRVTTMFAVSAILIGVLGIFYVRRRSARKKQSA